MLWIFLIAKATYVQIIPNNRLFQLKEKLFQRVIHLKSRRGAIFDRNHQEMAISVPSYSLYIDPMIIKNPKTISKKLGSYFKKPYQDYYQKIKKNKSRRFVWIERYLSQSQRDNINAWKIYGLVFMEESKRVYPNDQLLAHLLGFVGSEERGLEGLELFYNDLLQGKNRKLKFYKDARGRPLLVNGQVFLDHPDGVDLYLTIDSGLQFKLEKELKHVVNQFHAASAVGVVLDAKTSAVLAMANFPTFNANKPTQFEESVRRNRAVTDSFEPGSSLKAITIAGALSQGVIEPNTQIDCENGVLKIGGHTIREANFHKGFKLLTVSEVLAYSSNIGSSKIAFRLGDKKLREVFKNFGFGQKTGIDLPGEARGILQKLPWKKHLFSNISFGHGITVTPLQIANAYAAIANGGLLKKPYVLKSIVDNDSGLREDFLPQTLRRVLTPKDASTMKFMLAGVTLPGATGFNARVQGFPVAGKTGTAQKVKVGRRGYADGKYISSFVGFIPVNQPKYVIYIAVDSPHKHYHGSQVAAPVFSRVAGYAALRASLPPVLLSQKDIMKNMSYIYQKKSHVRNVQKSKVQNISSETLHASPETFLQDSPQALHTSKAFRTSLSEKDIFLSRRQQLQKRALRTLREGKVFKSLKTPKLIGLPLREAYRQITGTDIKLKVKGSGVIAKMFPQPGELLPKDKTVTVHLKPRH